ncbi:hypothetical protein ACGFPO_48125, partial [Streptomyces phaeochromogenes]
MEDAFTTDVDLAEPLEAATVPLPGIELAEALHHDQYPALVRFLLSSRGVCAPVSPMGSPSPVVGRASIPRHGSANG